MMNHFNMIINFTINPEINNTLFVKSSSKIINLKYLVPNMIDRNSTYDVKELNRPIKVISDIENYIEKYKIHHQSLIEYYKSSLLDIKSFMSLLSSFELTFIL